MPVVGFLIETGETASPPSLAAFRLGMAELGFVERKNIAFGYRFANFKRGLLPQLASDLVRRKVNVIFAQLRKRLSLPGRQRPAFRSWRWIWRAILLRRGMSRVLRAQATI